MKVYVISEREVIEMAMKTFEKATLRLKFSQGLNEKGQVIEKQKHIKIFQNKHHWMTWLSLEQRLLVCLNTRLSGLV